MSKLSPNLDTDDASNPKLNAASLDFLLIELIPLAQRITEQVQAREKAMMEEYRKSRLLHQQQRRQSQSKQDNSNSGSQSKGSHSAHASLDGAITIGTDAGTTETGAASEAGGVSSTGFPTVTDPVREGMFHRLDALGYRVGQGLVERFSTNKPRPLTPLDSIKFICKDLWTLVFRKQIDNLKTNHRGIFVLTDQRFHALSRMSVDRHAGGQKGLEEALARAQLSLYFPCGIIRGALQGLGIEAVVTAESNELPTATFQIKTKGSSS